MSHRIYYFAYGSNLHPTRLRQRTPSCQSLGVAVLFSHALRFHKRGGDGSGKCNVLPTGDPQDQVYGAVYALVADERMALDRAEGLGHGYTLVTRTLRLPGVEREIFYYSADPAYIDDALRPYQWYKDLVIHGSRFHRLPLLYQRALQEVTAVPDIDPRRNALHRHILESVPSRSGWDRDNWPGCAEIA
ncbi:MAG: gamma-glutamylcyclotransferase [Gammaproteobacteria bacterium]|nr:gamma-glutamylcyclotransferase [Gammaproteobacteria bacterium]MCP5459123.1 gamma-glutamylcyclotransferase [Gammaproteobacteria bacterium]